MKREGHNFSIFKPKTADASWQIDNDHLPPPHDDGDWESNLAMALRDVAESHENGELAVFTWSDQSFDFGHPGFSVWVAFSGSPPMVKAARDILVEMIESRYRRSDAVNPHAFWQPRIRVADGHVWVPEDAANWVALETEGLAEGEASSPAEIEAEAEAEADRNVGAESDSILDDFEDPPEDSKSPKKARRAGLRQSFQYNVRLSYYQRKIEQLGGMPEGSVRFVTPDGELANPNMHVGTLRRRWEDEAG